MCTYIPIFWISLPRRSPQSTEWSSLGWAGGSHCGGLVTQSRPTLATPRTSACQALSIAFSRQEYWSGLSFPSPGIFLIQGLNSGLLHCRVILYQLSYQGSSALYSWFSLVICFIHNSIYVSIPISQFFPTPSSPLGVHMFVLYFCFAIKIL